MGCILKIIRNLLILALIAAFFAFGGWAFLKNVINKYRCPTRSEFVDKELDLADFSKISENYQLIRNFNLVGYKKVTAKYLPIDQNISILNFKDKHFIECDDFSNGKIDEKIQGILNNFKDSLVTFENIEIIQRGKTNGIHYIVFTSQIKNVPLKTVVVSFGCYRKGEDTIIIFTMVDKYDYNPLVFKGFIETLKI